MNVQRKQELLFYQKQKAKSGKIWNESAFIIQQTCRKKKVGFLQNVIAVTSSQKSSWSPGEDFKKGEGRTQVIYLKMSVSDNDVMLSSTSRPASLWDEGMSRTTPDTRLWLCPGIRGGSAINCFFRSYMQQLCLWKSSRLCCSTAKDNIKHDDTWTEP